VHNTACQSHPPPHRGVLKLKFELDKGQRNKKCIKALQLNCSNPFSIQNKEFLFRELGVRGGSLKDVARFSRPHQVGVELDWAEVDAGGGECS